MLVMSRIRHAAIRLGAGQNIPKNRCRTTIAEPIGEPLAELPFIEDQVVCLSHDQAGGEAGSPRSNLMEVKD